MTTALAVEVPRQAACRQAQWKAPTESAHRATCCFPVMAALAPLPRLCSRGGPFSSVARFPPPCSLTPCHPHDVPAATAAPAPTASPCPGSGTALPGVLFSFLPWRLLPYAFRGRSHPQGLAQLLPFPDLRTVASEPLEALTKLG